MTTAAPTWRDFERAGWQHRALAYHRFFGPVCASAAEAVLDAVGAGAGTRVLDACCGPGYLAGAAAARGGAVCGVDIAPAMVALAGGIYPAAHFVAADAERLPFGNAMFDVVTCGIGIHHLTDPRLAIAEFTRVLRPSGRLALTVWDDHHDEFGLVKQAITTVAKVAPATLPAVPARPDYCDEAEIANLLASERLTPPTFTPVTVSYRFRDPGAVWDGWLPTAIRTAPLLAAQPLEVQQAARAEFARIMAARICHDGSVTLSATQLLILTVAR